MAYISRLIFGGIGPPHSPLGRPLSLVNILSVHSQISAWAGQPVLQTTTGRKNIALLLFFPLFATPSSIRLLATLDFWIRDLRPVLIGVLLSHASENPFLTAKPLEMHSPRKARNETWEDFGELQGKLISLRRSLPGLEVLQNPNTCRACVRKAPTVPHFIVTAVRPRFKRWRAKAKPQTGAKRQAPAENRR